MTRRRILTLAITSKGALPMRKLLVLLCGAGTLAFATVAWAGY